MIPQQKIGPQRNTFRLCSQTPNTSETQQTRHSGLYLGIGCTKIIALIASYEVVFFTLPRKMGRLPT